MTQEYIESLTDKVATLSDARPMNIDQVRSALRRLEAGHGDDVLFEIHKRYQSKFPDYRYPDENYNWEYH
jgi:hypothetical protein